MLCAEGALVWQRTRLPEYGLDGSVCHLTFCSIPAQVTFGCRNADIMALHHCIYIHLHECCPLHPQQLIRIHEASIDVACAQQNLYDEEVNTLGLHCRPRYVSVFADHVIPGKQRLVCRAQGRSSRAQFYPAASVSPKASVQSRGGPHPSSVLPSNSTSLSCCK